MIRRLSTLYAPFSTPSVGRLLGGALILGSFGCAAMYRSQLGDIEPYAKSGHPISVKVSETTVNLAEIAKLAKIAGHGAKSGGLSRTGTALDYYVSFFQYGPTTGTPVYNDMYALVIPERLQQECPGGHISNIQSVREARDYPVVKGEIVRVDAICTR